MRVLWVYYTIAVGLLFLVGGVIGLMALGKVTWADAGAAVTALMATMQLITSKLGEMARLEQGLPPPAEGE